MSFDPVTVQRVASVLMYLAAALAAGASVAAVWIARGRSHWSAGRLPAIGRCALAGPGIALLASAAVLWLESAAMAEVPLAEAAGAVQSMLTETHYGAAWMVGAAALAVAFALNLFMPRRLVRYTSAGTGLALAVFWYTRSMTSHAASEGDFSLPLIVDWLHLALISLWVGEVIVAGVATLAGDGPGSEGDRRDRAAYVASLSSSATLALAGIFATGLFGIWHNLGSVANLLGNPYGLALLAKLATVGLAVLLGGFNRFFVMPPWVSAESAGAPVGPALPRRFRLVLQAEAFVLVAALALAVVLAATSPP